MVVCPFQYFVLVCPHLQFVLEYYAIYALVHFVTPSLDINFWEGKYRLDPNFFNSIVYDPNFLTQQFLAA